MRVALDVGTGEGGKLLSQREEAARQAQAEAERQAREEAVRQAQVEAERKAQEEAARQAPGRSRAQGARESRPPGTGRSRAQGARGTRPAGASKSRARSACECLTSRLFLLLAQGKGHDGSPVRSAENSQGLG